MVCANSGCAISEPFHGPDPTTTEMSASAACVRPCTPCVSMRRSMPSCSFENSDSRGSSISLAKYAGTCRRTLLRP